MRLVIFQINTDFLINQLTKCFYTRHLTPLLYFKKNKLCSPSQNLLEISTFYQIFTSSDTGWGVSVSNKYQPPYNFAKRQYFYTRDFISLLHFGKKIGALHRKDFSKHPLFTTFSLFLKANEVWNISNKCWFPNNSVNKIFLHKTAYAPPALQKILRSPSQNILETFTFYFIFPSFHSGWGVLYFK